MTISAYQFKKMWNSLFLSLQKSLKRTRTACGVSEAQTQSHWPSSPSESLLQDHPCTCLTLCLLFLPQHALTLNPLFMLPHQGWDTKCHSSSMLPLLEEEASREGRQQSSLEHPAGFLPWPAQCWARPSSGGIRGLELSTQFQNNSTPTFLEQFLTKGFNHSVKRIQGQTKLETKQTKKSILIHSLWDFNSTRRASTEKEIKNTFLKQLLAQRRSVGCLGTTLQYHSYLDQNSKFHPSGIVQRDILVWDTKHQGVPYHYSVLFRGAGMLLTSPIQSLPHRYALRHRQTVLLKGLSLWCVLMHSPCVSHHPWGGEFYKKGDLLMSKQKVCFLSFLAEWDNSGVFH